MERLERVERELVRLRTVQDNNLEAERPFTKRIRETQISRSFRLPRPLEAYSETEDPNAFMRKYKRAI